MEFWNEIIIDKSFRILKELRKKIDFILIGGWAVYFLTKAVKSKDIDIIVDLKNLSKIKEGFELKKTDFLKKYEIEIEGISIDIYVPFYSKFAIPVEDVMKNTIVIENFKIPRAEVLLLLKQQAELERKDSIKGQKDRVDIICLLKSDLIDWNFYKKMIERYGLKDYPKRLESIIRQSKDEFEYLGIKDLREVKKIKERILKQMKSSLL
jgi:hypothetical protein